MTACIGRRNPIRNQSGKIAAPATPLPALFPTMEHKISNTFGSQAQYSTKTPTSDTRAQMIRLSASGFLSLVFGQRWLSIPLCNFLSDAAPLLISFNMKFWLDHIHPIVNQQGSLLPTLVTSKLSLPRAGGTLCSQGLQHSHPVVPQRQG